MPKNLDKYNKEFEKNRRELIKMNMYVLGAIVFIVLIIFLMT